MRDNTPVIILPIKLGVNGEAVTRFVVKHYRQERYLRTIGGLVAKNIEDADHFVTEELAKSNIKARGDLDLLSEEEQECQTK